jgi:DNA-directed RNA polymerase
MRDLEHSRNRWLDQEEVRAGLTGHGTTRQGQAIVRKYRDALAKLMLADRRRARDKALAHALRGLSVDRLLTMGITAAAGDGIGVDDDGIKNFRDQAIWLGEHITDRVNDRDVQFKAGQWAIQLLARLPIFILDDDVLTLPLTPDLDDFLDGVVQRGYESQFFLWPTAERPEPWSQVSKGGLPASNNWARASLISGNHRDSENAVRDAIARGKQQVLDALNYLASTPFIINGPVLDFMLRREEPRIQKLAGDVAELERERELRKLKWPERQKLANLRAELSIWSLDTAVANAMGRFHVPLQMDFRGRINPLPFFNFTREDRVRALFLFANGVPIGEEGLRHLKSHVAACADGNKWTRNDKPSNLDLDERIAWVDQHLSELCGIGEAVLRRDDPVKVDWALKSISDPYQFVAGCVELVRALNTGPGFITRLPLTVDATCSGLQHLCLMVRDEIGGRYVNVAPPRITWTDANELGPVGEAKSLPGDFYSLLGTKVWREHPELRHFFKDGNPFDREIVKRPAMTYGYGSRAGGWQIDKPKRGAPKRRKKPKAKGMTEQVVDVLKERGMSTKGAHKFAKAIFDAMEELMPAAKAVRDFVEKTASVCAKYNVPLRWTTLLGFPVVNAYYDPITETYSVKIGDHRRRTNAIIGDTDEVKRARSRNSATANFTHSVDACHLQMVALVARQINIPLATIHDCFGTLAPHVGQLEEILLEQLRRLHGRNLLNEFRESAKRDLPKRAHDELPELPKFGNLDIEGDVKSLRAFK